MFINFVNLVLDLLGTIQPELDVFERSTVFLSIRSKITGKALESIKDSNIRGWDDLRERLLRNFEGEINLNDNTGIIAQVDEKESDSYQTIHSDDENKINNVTYKEGYRNTGKKPDCNFHK